MLQAQVLDDLILQSDHLYTTVNANLEFTENTLAYFPFSTSVSDTYNVNQYQIKLKELEATELSQDIGLVFKANANYNFRDAFDEEQNNFNRFRFRAELEWNILKNGFIHNRTKVQQKSNEAENLRLLGRDAKKELWRRQFRIDYNYIGNKEVVDLLTDFIDFENQYFDVLNKLYSESLIKREPLIRVGNQIHVLKNQLEILERENAIIRDSVSENGLKYQKLPIFSIRTDSISLQSLQYDNSFLQDNIELQHRAINDLSLSVYINQNINYSLAQTQYFPAMGIRFKAPIRFNKRQDIIKTKLQLVTAEEKDRSVGCYNEIITYINMYNEKLRDLQNQYKNWRIVQERIRVLDLMKKELNDYNTGLLILELTEEKFEILQNVIQIKRQLYTTISHIYQLSPIDDIQDLLAPYFFQEKIEKQYILFTPSEEYTLEYQREYIKTKPEFAIVVKAEHKDIQNYLQNNAIAYTIATNENIETISQLMTKELKKINL